VGGDEKIRRPLAANSIVPFVNCRELPRVHSRREVCQLVDNRVRRGVADRGHHALVIEHVAGDRFDSALTEVLDLLGIPREGDNGVPRLDEPRNHLAPDRPGCARYKHAHELL
jgi:hypothetical protein